MCHVLVIVNEQGHNINHIVANSIHATTLKRIDEILKKNLCGLSEPLCTIVHASQDCTSTFQWEN